MIDILKGLRYFLSSDPNDFKHAGVGAVISDDEQKRVLAEESLFYECSKCGYRYDKHIEHFEGKIIETVPQSEPHILQSHIQYNNDKEVAKLDIMPITPNENIINPENNKYETESNDIIKENSLNEDNSEIIRRVLKNKEGSVNPEKGVNTDDIYYYQENLYQFSFTSDILEELTVYKNIINNVTYEKHIKTETSRSSIRSWITTLNILEALGSIIVLAIISKYAFSVITNQFETLVKFN